MKAGEIRATFLSFFKDKQHEIVASAPLVLKNDPTLLFTNAGMNQFKDYFLNYKAPTSPRIADTQKCLRVSGKHNDLEDVGKDTYHHTMFEMLGNWSFGDYFKKDAIAWAWELLTEKYGISKDRIYVTIFEGDESENLERDQEAFNFWSEWLPEDRILDGNKKDNFWEMGDTGPSGPCSEIHVDIRSDEERNAIDGKSLVNQDHPQVIELWNLVFMQFNRKADGSLEKLPQKHVDTGMGFERLCMVLQGKSSNYDTDVFTPLINKLEQLSSISYRGAMTEEDIAIRVIVDHIRAIAFSIADGQLPSNTGAGYVIRRILRRAVRYGYSFLQFDEPFLFQLIPVLVNEMGEAFPELKAQQSLIEKVVQEEEQSFLRTLESGLKRLDGITTNLSGKQAFELYDTFGFPLDLTRLIAQEKGLTVDEAGFTAEMQKQKERSRKDAKVETGDWRIFSDGLSEFIGYDRLTTETSFLRTREVQQKGNTIYQIVLKETPFYAESGGQVGDQGIVTVNGKSLNIFDTKKENELIILFTADKLPELTGEETVVATVDREKRLATENNHSATHLLHAALRKVLGTHVEQKGSLVAPDKLRFDFSHYRKVTDEELQQIEDIVNDKIAQNIQIGEDRAVPFSTAIERGAMALFGEKYGDDVRVITFDPDYSVELCGGCHVASTALIRLFKITSESASSAGIRRIEAITGKKAQEYYQQQEQLVKSLSELLNNNKNPLKAVETLIDENKQLQHQMDDFVQQQAGTIKQQLKSNARVESGIHFIGEVVDIGDAAAIKNLAFELKNEVENLVLVLGAEVNGKPLLTVMISDNLVEEKNLNAGVMIRELAKQIKGGGGGQPFYATAGGKDVSGLPTAIEMARSLVMG